MGDREKQRGKDSACRDITVESALKKCLDEAAVNKFFADCDGNYQQDSYTRFACGSRKKLFRETGDNSALVGRKGGNPAQTEDLIQDEGDGENGCDGDGTLGIRQSDTETSEREVMRFGTPENDGNNQPLKGHRREIQLNALGGAEGRSIQQEADPGVASPGNEDAEQNKDDHIVPVHEAAQHYAVKWR